MNTSKLIKIAASLGLAAAFALSGAIPAFPVFAEEGSIETIDVGTVDGVKENGSASGITVSENGTIVSSNTGSTSSSSAQSSTGVSSGNTDSYNSGEIVMSTYNSMSSTNDVLNSIDLRGCVYCWSDFDDRWSNFAQRNDWTGAESCNHQCNCVCYYLLCTADPDVVYCVGCFLISLFCARKGAFL